jgi:ATP-dependent exoDNAse (exonuclease V) alpha subunit
MKTLNRVLTILSQENVFLTGGAGVGKSYMTKQIIKYYKDSLLNSVVLGSTGISAVNVGGQTIHSFFVFGISSDFEELSRSDRYNKNRIKELNKILKNLELLVIDEISMVSSNLMDMILYRLRNGKFKGRILVVGDFYQLPPVIKFGKKSTVFDDEVYAFESSAWDQFEFNIVELTKIKRTTDEEFMKVLNSVRVGELDKYALDYLINLKEKTLEIEDSTTLFGRNQEADRLNLEKISLLKREEFTKEAILTIQKEKLDQRKIDNWIKTLPIIPNLKLKEGVPIIFTSNKWGAYYNGERALVEHIDDDSIVLDKNGQLLKVDRFDFDLSQTVVNDKGEVENETLCTLSQFPIRPAYAITIHKSQGMSLDNLVCNVDNIFADSQFYVALSRAVEPKRLKIVFGRGDFIGYLKRVVRVSNKVKEFYKNRQTLRVEEV